MTEKTYIKKLTSSGVGVCSLTGLAAVLACCGAAGDLLAAAIYGQFYTRQIYPIYTDPMEQLRHYGGAIVTAVFAVIMFVWALSAARGKRLGREYGIMGVFMGAAFCLSPAEQLITLITPDFTNAHFNTGYDSDIFHGVVELARPGLPMAAGILLFLSGIAVLARIGNESFIAEVPCATGRDRLAQRSRARSAGSTLTDIQSSKAEDKTLPDEAKPSMTSTSVAEKPTRKESPAREEKSVKDSLIKLCFKCGELVGDDELFCANCGQKI